jgi:hypothetical protein
VQSYLQEKREALEKKEKDQSHNEQVKVTRYSISIKVQNKHKSMSCMRILLLSYVCSVITYSCYCLPEG